MIPNQEIPAALQNWIPYRLFWEESQAYCRWLFTGNKEFTEPFFEETLEKCKQFPANSNRIKCMSDTGILPEWADHIESVKPAAFIFHVSRCGSTLLSQLLGLNPANIILSEVPFFDELLRWKTKTTPADEATVSRLLKAAITFYGAKRHATQQRLFIKTDSWHIFFYRQLRALFPQTPFILLYRRPAEVIRSHQKLRGMQAVPGLIAPELFGFDPDNIMNVSLDEYMALVLERYFSAFLSIVKKDPLAVLISYHESPVTAIEKIAAAAGFDISGEEMNNIKRRAGYHAKYPTQVFSEEPLPCITPAFLTAANDLYEMLEEMRMGITSWKQ